MPPNPPPPPGQSAAVPPQLLQLTNKGLHTMENSLSAVPPGSQNLAKNVVVSYDGLLSGRRGIKQYGTSLAALTSIATTEVFQEFAYKGTTLIWYGDATAGISADARYYFGYDSDLAGTWIQTTHPFSGPSYQLTDTYRSAQSNDNIYFTSTTGILKTDAPANALYQAGGLPGLDGTATLTGSSGFMSDGTEVAYRMTWTFTDANNNAVQGTPSTRLVIANGSGHSSNVSLTYTIPVGATTAYKWQIYRTIMSASVSTDPGDEEQLAAEGNPTSGEITARSFTVVDALPESELGAALYTNSGQQGIAQANNIPPVASDMCFFVGYMIYGSVTTQQLFQLSLLATGPSSGIQSGDTFTVTRGSSTFTLHADTTETPATGHFKVFTGGTPADDILDTKLSLVHVLNLYASNTLVYAFDASDSASASSLPGDFYLQERGIGGGVFGVASSRSTCWNPALTATPSDNPSLAGGGAGSGLCSKYLQPESVPVANTIAVGNPNFEWLRCLPLRNSVIVLKADGLFQLTGSTYPFSVTTLDTGTILTAPESPAVMNNQVFAYTNQGIVAISETGPGIISRPIENQLQVISSYLYPQFPAVSFGTAYQTDRKYLFSTISESDQFLKATTQYVYDTITETWTNYVYPIPVWDIIESPVDHRLYVTSADSAYPNVFRERKTFTRVDGADIELPITIVAYTGNLITVNSTATATVGWSLAQLTLESAEDPAIILGISKITAIVDATHLRVADSNVIWDTTGGQFSRLEQPIPIDVIYNPITCGNPSGVKFFQEIQFFFQQVDFSFINFLFYSDLAPVPLTAATPISLVPKFFSSGWGSGSWGGFAWGGGEATAQSFRTYIPLLAKRAHWLTTEIQISEAMTTFSFAGLILTYRDYSTRSK